MTTPARGKTTPASTAGSFTAHTHGVPDVDLIDVTMEIENVYEDGTEITTHVTTQVPRPEASDYKDGLGDWADENLFDHTGADYPEGGDAGYFVNITASSDPRLVGQKVEFC